MWGAGAPFTPALNHIHQATRLILHPRSHSRKRTPMPEPEWRRANRLNWDERVCIHVGPRGYDVSDLRAGYGRLHTIEEAELPSVQGKRIAHLQCHFGADS